MMGELIRRNAVTNAFIHAYRPLRIHPGDPSAYPDYALNVLARTLADSVRCQRGSWYLFEPWADWRTADFLLCPVDLNYGEGLAVEEIIGSLPHFKAHPERYLFVDHRDDPRPFVDGPAVQLKVSLSRRYAGERVIAIPYLDVVDDFRWYTGMPAELLYELCFIGQSTPGRLGLVDALRARTARAHFELRDRFFHGPLLSRAETSHGEMPMGHPEKDALRRQYVELLRTSRFALAPAGFGVNSFRFFEALSLGVPPVLVSEDCALPFEDDVDYARFSIIVSSRLEDAAGAIVDAVRATSPEGRELMAALARAAYDAALSYEAAPLAIYRRLLPLV
jgi:exostosin family protein